jgi:hypothetical protein
VEEEGLSLKPWRNIVRPWLLILLLLPAGALPAVAAGTLGADVLQERLSPRGEAMGGAYAAVGQDLQVLDYDPAGMAGLGRIAVDFSHMAAALGTTYDDLGYAQPFSFGVFAFTGLYRTMPAIDNPGAVDPPVSNNDMVLQLAYAHKLAYFAPQLFTGILSDAEIGLGLKYMSSLLGSQQAYTGAADIGLRATVYPNVAASLSLLNLGPPIKYIDTADPLPASARAGLAGDWALSKTDHLVLAADGEALADGTTRLHLGAENRLADILALRAGYILGQAGDLTGLSLGIGLVLDQDSLMFRFDYAYEPLYYSGFSAMESQQVIGLGLGF